MCKTRKSTMGGGMRIAAHHRHAGQGRALLRPDHVHDALTAIVHIEIGQPVFFGVVIERFYLQTRNRISNTF